MNQIIPKISIIMATYNEPLDWIRESIESMLYQTMVDFEFIIINDNPKRKDLFDFLEEYKKRDNRVIIIKNTENLGLTKSLNIGLSFARGKYIARMDADDISLENRLQVQYDFLESHTEIFLIGGGAEYIDKNGKYIMKNIPLTSHLEIEKRLQIKNCLLHPTILFRKSRDIRYRDKLMYVEDYDLYLNLLTSGKRLENLSQILIKCRTNPNSIRQTKAAYQALFREQAKSFYLERLKFNKDSYSDFDPESILNVNIENSNNKIILEANIKSNFLLGEYKKMREYCVRYFIVFGAFNKFLFYYLASFLGIKVISFVASVVPQSLLRKLNN